MATIKLKQKTINIDAVSISTAKTARSIAHEDGILSKDPVDGLMKNMVSVSTGDLSGIPRPYVQFELSETYSDKDKHRSVTPYYGRFKTENDETSPIIWPRVHPKHFATFFELGVRDANMIFSIIINQPEKFWPKYAEMDFLDVKERFERNDMEYVQLGTFVSIPETTGDIPFLEGVTIDNFVINKNIVSKATAFMYKSDLVDQTSCLKAFIQSNDELVIRSSDRTIIGSLDLFSKQRAERKVPLTPEEIAENARLEQRLHTLNLMKDRLSVEETKANDTYKMIVDMKANANRTPADDKELARLEKEYPSLQKAILDAKEEIASLP